MLAKNNNIFNYSIYHKGEKYPLDNKKPNSKKNQKDLIGKSLDNKSIKNILLEHISQDGFFVSGLFSFWREIRFNEQKFLAIKLILDIKYYYSGF